MPVLTDTNIFLRLLQPHHPHYQIAARALDSLRAREEVLNVASQNLVELWVAATRPASQNGLGFTVKQAVEEIDKIKRLWVLLPEVPLFEEWERLVRTHNVSGKSAHDARLVAAMNVHGISNILTFNVDDFTRYSDVRVLNPADFR